MDKVRAYLIGKVLRGVDVEGVRKEEIRNMKNEVRGGYERILYVGLLYVSINLI